MPITAKLNYEDIPSPQYNRSESWTEPNVAALFVRFYQANKSLRFCNGCWWKFDDKGLEAQYLAWRKSLTHNESFAMFYGGGLVD